MRTVIGALVGANFVLMWNDLARPYAFYLFREATTKPVVARSSWITGNQWVLERPKTPLEASIWADAGAYRLRFARKPSVNDLANLLRGVQIGAEMEPTNAFWPQMEAILYNTMDQRTKAIERWTAASRKPKWDDHQPERLRKVVEEVERATKQRSSWPLFALTAFRNDNAAQLCLRFAYSIVQSTGFEKRKDLELRYATLVNGTLIRDFGSSIGIHGAGADIMELASYPPDMDAYPTNKALVLARINFVDSLRNRGMADEANFAYKQYQENDARNYYLGSANPAAELRQFTLAAVLVATVPSCLLGISLIAAILWAVGGAMLKFPPLQKVLEMPYAPIIGVITAILIYALLKLWLLALSAAATFAFATFAPNRERSHPSEDLGPFFRFSIVMIGSLLTAVLGVFLISLTEAAQISNYVIQVPEEFAGGSVAMVVLAIVCLGLLILIAPAWAIVRKLRTPWVFAVGLRDLGKGLFVGAGLLSIVSCLIAVSLDRPLYAKGSALLHKEPLYYMATHE